MSLDFQLTQFFRLITYDVILLWDAYTFYSTYRPKGKSIKEFSKVLQNLLEVEYQNFEEINTSKLSQGREGESLQLLVWDYFQDIILKHWLDDLSQYPFWAAKVIVTSRNETFGLPVLRAYGKEVRRMFLSFRNISTLFEGSVPYLTASMICNYRYLLRTTHYFVLTAITKLPHSNSFGNKQDTSSEDSSPLPGAAEPQPEQQQQQQRLPPPSHMAVEPSFPLKQALTQQRSLPPRPSQQPPQLPVPSKPPPLPHQHSEHIGAGGRATSTSASTGASAGASTGASTGATTSSGTGTGAVSVVDSDGESRSRSRSGSRGLRRSKSGAIPSVMASMHSMTASHDLAAAEGRKGSDGKASSSVPCTISAPSVILTPAPILIPPSGALQTLEPPPPPGGTSDLSPTCINRFDGEAVTLIPAAAAVMLEDHKDQMNILHSDSSSPTVANARNRVGSNAPVLFAGDGAPGTVGIGQGPTPVPAGKIGGGGGGTVGDDSSNCRYSGSFAEGGRGGGPVGVVVGEEAFRSTKDINSYSTAPLSNGSKFKRKLTSGGGNGSGSSSTRKPPRSPWQKAAEQIAMTIFSQPFLVLSTNMVLNPAYRGSNCVIAYFTLLANNGIIGLYAGIRSRLLFNVLAASPFLLLGFGDMIFYRRMGGQGPQLDQSGGIISITRDIISSNSAAVASAATGAVSSTVAQGMTAAAGAGSGTVVGADGSAVLGRNLLNVLNYGLLSLVHVVPGFLSFISVRLVSLCVFRTSIQRKHQIGRRRLIVESQVNLIDKKHK